MLLAYCELSDEWVILFYTKMENSNRYIGKVGKDILEKLEKIYWKSFEFMDYFLNYADIITLLGRYFRI